MSKRWNMATAVGLMVLAFAAVPSSQRTPTDAPVYSALFKGEYPSLAPLPRLVVKSTAIPMPTIAGSSVEWLAAWTEIPAALRRAAEQPVPIAGGALSAALFPKGTRLVSNEAVEAAFVRALGAEDNWVSFRRQYGAIGWVVFSQVLYTADESDALVYYEGRCGGTCGEGGYVWLHRDGIRSTWVIRKKFLSWVS